MMTHSDKFQRRLPAGIWALGFCSMFMDISSELVHSLLPIFMTTVLGASMVTVGLIEGIAEATAAMVKVFSGVISDYFGKRKWLAVAGYGLGALSKPIFPLASSIGWVFTGRFIDRIGKGIRVAPRDALVADITPADQRGAAYGLRQSLDSVGAFIGPLLAVLAMFWFAGDLTSALWIGVVPGFIAVMILAIGVREPRVQRTPGAVKAPLHWRDARRLPRRYWLVVALGAVFTLARFSEAFLVLRAESIGVALMWVPVIMIVMNIVYALSAYPVGVLADRIGNRALLYYGMLALVLADIVLAWAASYGWVLLGAALWGLHMGMTQGLFNKLIADSAPVELRGSAFGVFNLVSGVALLLASAIAGALWQIMGPAATFVAGMVFALITASGIAYYRRRSK